MSDIQTSLLRVRMFDRRWFALPAAVLLLPVTFATPLVWATIDFIINLVGGEPNRLWSPADAWPPLVRTLLLAIISSALAVSIGFSVSLWVRATLGRPTLWSCLMLVPALLGGGSVGFIFRDLPAFFPVLRDRDQASTLAALVLVTLWQYAPLSLYLFWLRLDGLTTSIREFASAAQFDQTEYIRHIAWPRCRQLAFVLTLFAFLQACAEYGQSLLMFRPSAGTSTLMLSHWIEQKHGELLKNFEIAARQLALGYSGVFLLFVLPLALGTAYAVSSWVAPTAAIVMASIPYRRTGRPGPGRKRVTTAILWFLLLGPLASLLWRLWKEPMPIVGAAVRSAVTLMTESLPWVIAAATATTVIAVTVGVLLRLLWPSRTDRFSNRSLPVLSIVLLLHAIPSMGLAYCAHFWIRLSHVSSSVFWLSAEVVAAFSVVAVFALYVHFDVASQEIVFYRSATASVPEAAWNGFVSRFRVSYALIALFAITTILNEDTLNAVLATHFNSLIATLGSAQIKDYPMAAASILVMAILSATLAILWSSHASKSIRPAKALQSD